MENDLDTIDSAGIDTERSGAGQFLTFDLGPERYAVGVRSVEVVLEMPSITRVPKSPAYLRGVINHRGSVVPVVDLRSLFGMEKAPSGASSSIIVTQVDFEGESLTAGVLADSVQEVIDLDGSSVEPPPTFGSRVDGSFVKGIGKRGDRFIILLDLERALSGKTSADQPNRQAERD